MILSMTSSSSVAYKIVQPSILDEPEHTQVYELVPHKENELPIEASLGTVYLGNSASLIECYSYYDLNFKVEPYYSSWTQKIISVRFLKLSRMDKIHFSSWDDFDMYDTAEFHKFIFQLRKQGFKIMTKK